MITIIVLTVIFALANRARGSKLFEKSLSTQLSRIVATGAMAIATGFLSSFVNPDIPFWGFFVFWLLLFGWSVPGTGRYFVSITGDKEAWKQKEIKTIDWVLEKLPIKEDDPLSLKIKATIGMCLRQALILPAIVFLSFYLDSYQVVASLLLPVFMGLSFFVSGYISKTRPVEIAEYLCGAMMGLLVSGIIIK